MWQKNSAGNTCFLFFQQQISHTWCLKRFYRQEDTDSLQTGLAGRPTNTLNVDIKTSLFKGPISCYLTSFNVSDRQIYDKMPLKRA